MKTTKSKVLAAVLAFGLGSFGGHNFYLGHINLGLVKLVVMLFFSFLASWIPFIGGIFRIVPFVLFLWGVVDGVLILSGRVTSDYHGNEIL